MIFDSLRERMGGRDNLTPMQIAHHPLFSVKDKIDLLNQLKAQVTTDDAKGNAEGEDVGFRPEEIDAAIAEVRKGSENNVGADTVFKGDF